MSTNGNGLPPSLQGPDPLGFAANWVRSQLPDWDPRLTTAAATITVIVLSAVALWLLLRRRNASAGHIAAWSAQAQRNDGVADAATIRRIASAKAIRRRARVLRPALSNLSARQLRRVSPLAYATPLAKVGSQWIWSPVEDVTLRVGGPRTGKTGELACRILDAPGAVIVTSTRTDVIDLTGPLRSHRGPVHVFNPAGFPGQANTICFDPVAGCTDVNIAAYRAEDLLSAASGPDGSGDRDFWKGQAQRVLTALLHIAALGELTLLDVQRWVADPDGSRTTVTRLLAKCDQKAAANEAAQFLTTNHATRTSICTGIMPALRWLADPAATATLSSGASFDVADLLRKRATVFLLGAEDAKTAPLLAALTGHIAREARRLALGMPGGRLDPPLTLVLDEAALICPVPLDNWTADMGGRNVTIHIAVQSRAQLRQRYGDTGAAAILNNCATVLIFGGGGDTDDLAAWSTLSGERLEQVVNRDANGRISSTSTRRVPVLSPAEIAQLPPRHVLIKRRGMPSAIGTVQMAWERKDVRLAEREASRSLRRSARQERRQAVRDCLSQWFVETALPWIERRGAAINRMLIWVEIRILGDSPDAHLLESRNSEQGSHR